MTTVLTQSRHHWGNATTSPFIPTGSDTIITTKGEPMTTQTFPVTGLTCGHCVGAVTSELSTLAGVTDVQIDLVVEGTSTLRVTSDQKLTGDQVAVALDEAGEYKLVSS
jgi:copper chaperone